MIEINKLRKLYQLKNVERVGKVKERQESPAEHSWSSLILADYVINNFKIDIDRLKVFELLMYHDIVEIEAGDVAIHHEKERENKKEEEEKAFQILKKDFPLALKDKFEQLFNEFENQQTKEAKFAKAIDNFDALVHELDYKEDWKGWTEEMVRKYHGKAIDVVPELKELFEKLIDYCKDKGYFDQD
jgi:putative hydrolases of HD superfamily